MMKLALVLACLVAVCAAKGGHHRGGSFGFGGHGRDVERDGQGRGAAARFSGVRHAQRRHNLRVYEQGQGVLVQGWSDDHSDIELEPSEVAARDYQLLVQDDSSPSPHTANIGKPRTFRGHVRGRPDANVAASLSEQGLYARVDEGGKTTFVDVNENEEEVTYDETEVEFAPKSACAAVHVEDRRDLDAIRARRRRAACGGDGEPLCVIRMAVDADYEYLQRYGTVAGVQDRVFSIINTMNLQYATVGLKVEIVRLIVRNTVDDPYSAFRASGILQEVRDHWRKYHTDIERDIVHMFTGKELETSTVGIAYVGALCSKQWGFGVVESDFRDNFAATTDLSAHELGHNCNADHCSCKEPPFTMNPSITSANRFSDATIDVIKAYVADIGCLEPENNPTREFNCKDGVDNDSDGQIDCDDSDCSSTSSCIEVNCKDGFDDDSDGQTDCDDPDCAEALLCRKPENEAKFQAADTPKPIYWNLDNDYTFTVQVTVPPGKRVVQVEAEVDIAHSWLGDLIVTLTNNAGVTEDLTNRAGWSGIDGEWGCSNNNLDCRFMANSPYPIDNCFAGPDDTCKPKGTLSNLIPADGNVDGTWTFRVVDNLYYEGGSVESLTIVFVLDDDCTQNSDCGGGFFCNEGSCVQCTANSHCSNGQVCKQDGNVCVACTENTHCPNSLVCSGANTCVTCTDDAHCPNNLVCSSANTCVTCEDNNDCSNNFVCSGSNQCVQCVNNNDCNGGACKDNVCVECVLNSDCSNGDVCTVYNKCVNCFAASGFPNAGCNLAQPYCREFDTSCVLCLENKHCKANEVCDSSSTYTCVDCLDNSHCPASAPFCLAKECVECVNSNNCANGEVCFQNSCVECASNSDCSNGDVCSQNTCVECASNSDCSQGVCSANTCVQCTQNSHCPSGSACQNNQCVQSNPCLGSGNDCTNNSDCCSGRCRWRRWRRNWYRQCQ